MWTMRAICKKVKTRYPGSGSEGSVRANARKTWMYDKECSVHGANREEAAITTRKISRDVYLGESKKTMNGGG